MSSGNLTEPHVPPNRHVSDVRGTLAGPELRQPVNAPPVQETPTPSCSLPSQTDVPHSVPLSVPTEEPQTVTESAEQPPVLPISQRLWNAAYVSLEKDDDTASLVISYVKLLTEVLAEKDTDTSTSGADIAAELNDPTKRQAHMRILVDEGRKKVTTPSKITKRLGDVVEYIQKAKGMIDIAIQSIPQAALPWAGVCIGLQVSMHLPYFGF